MRGKDDDDLEGKAAREEEVVREDKEDCVSGVCGRVGREGRKRGSKSESMNIYEAKRIRRLVG